MKIILKNRVIAITVVVFLSFILFSFMQFSKSYEGYKPKKGFVPDEITAIKVAEAIWLPIYGNKIYQYRPFKAKLINGKIWRVDGTLDADKGGTPTIEIQKSDCKVLIVFQGK